MLGLCELDSLSVYVFLKILKDSVMVKGPTTATAAPRGALRASCVAW